MHLLGLNQGICKLTHINTLEMMGKPLSHNVKGKHFSKTVAL